MPKKIDAPKVLLATSIGRGKEYCAQFMVDAIQRMEGVSDTLLVLDGVEAPSSLSAPSTWLVRPHEAYVPQGGVPASKVMQIVTAMREFARQEFLAGDWTHLYWHDGDMIPDPNIVSALLAHNLPVASGLYVTRDTSIPTAPYLLDPNVGWCILLTESDLLNTDEPLVPVLGAGMGCMLCDRATVEATPFRTPAQLAETPIGEDYGWCLDSGHPAVVDTAQRVWHVGAGGTGVRPRVGELRWEVVWSDTPHYVVNDIGGQWERGIPRTDITPEQAKHLDARFVKRERREIVIERKQYAEILSA